MDAHPETLPTPLTVTALTTRPSGGTAEQLASRVRAEIGTEDLARGAAPLVDELTVAWVIVAPEARDVPR